MVRPTLGIAQVLKQATHAKPSTDDIKLIEIGAAK
jgi:hypothetical protein